MRAVPGAGGNLRVYAEKRVGSAWMAGETAASEGPIAAVTEAWAGR